MLLNPDVTLAPGALSALVRWMDEHPAIGVASAELVAPEKPDVRSSGRALPSSWRVLLEASRLHRLLPPHMRGRILRGSYWRGGDQFDAGWVPGTAMIVRRAAVESVGLLDERFFLYGEDIEWCWRMRGAGWKVGVCSSAEARHREASSARRTFGDDEARRRMVFGSLEAVTAVKGQRYARRFARASALAMTLEAASPRRPRAHREQARTFARLWRAAAKDGCR